MQKGVRKVIRASKGIADMIDAFEGRLAEVDSKTNVNCTTIDSSDIEIIDSDWYEKYIDVGGGFGDAGEVYSLGEVKEYWNKNKDEDPELGYYSDFYSWWDDTKRHYMKEYDGEEVY